MFQIDRVQQWSPAARTSSQYRLIPKDGTAERSIRSLVYVRTDIVAVQISVGERATAAVSTHVPQQDGRVLRSTVDAGIWARTRAHCCWRLQLTPISMGWRSGRHFTEPRRSGRHRYDGQSKATNPPSTGERHVRRFEHSKIDLVLGREELANDQLPCQLYDLNHRSDHHAISATFAIQVQVSAAGLRQLFK